MLKEYRMAAIETVFDRIPRGPLQYRKGAAPPIFDNLRFEFTDDLRVILHGKFKKSIPLHGIGTDSKGHDGVVLGMGTLTGTSFVNGSDQSGVWLAGDPTRGILGEPISGYLNNRKMVVGVNFSGAPEIGCILLNLNYAGADDLSASGFHPLEFAKYCSSR